MSVSVWRTEGASAIARSRARPVRRSPLGGFEGAVGGVLGGLVVGFLVSGVVRMVLGWVRTVKRS